MNDSTKDKIKGLLATIAPAAATFLGGPLAGGVVRAASEALLGRPDGTDEDLLAAMATPDAALKLRELNNALEAERNRHAEALVAASDADRTSAREREVKTGDTTQKWLAYGVTVGFFGVLCGLMYGAPSGPMRDVLLVMVGSLGQAWGSVISYYYGSSRGSDAKTDLLARARE